MRQINQRLVQNTNFKQDFIIDFNISRFDKKNMHCKNILH